MIDLDSVRRRLWRAQHGRCGNPKCDKVLDLRILGAQVAHVLPQDKPMLRRYGPEGLGGLITLFIARRRP